jgi:hypothetical protein
VTDQNTAGIAYRLSVLSKHEIAAIGPLLAVVEDMLEDARRQYDRTCTAVLTQAARKFVEKLEEAVEQDRWLTVGRAAAVARRPEGTVRYWCRRGHVIARKVGAHAWEIDRESLLRRAEA